MTALAQYIGGRGETPTRRELNRMIERWEWFTTARRARALITGEPDPALTLPLMFWPTTVPTAAVGMTIADPTTRKEIAAEATPTLDLDARKQAAREIIDRFIAHGGYRIDPAGEEIQAKVDVDIDPEMVTEELAQIYLSQGMREEAEKIYRTLNLTR
jgi:hypothetical protein